MSISMSSNVVASEVVIGESNEQVSSNNFVIPQEGVDQLSFIGEVDYDLTNLPSIPESLGEEGNYVTLEKIESNDESVKAQLNRRDSWRITDSVFVGTGELTDINTMDLYYITTVQDTIPFLKVASSNNDIIAQLFMMDEAGNLYDTGFKNISGNGNITFSDTLPAYTYVLAVGSSNNAARASYTLSWNCSNLREGATSIIYNNADLSMVTVAYGGRKVCVNGHNILTSDQLHWEDHETSYTSTGHFGHDQYIYSPQIKGSYLGSYTSSRNNSNRALFVELDEGTQWSMRRTDYSNIEGTVSHIDNPFDLTGRKTPRGLGANDVTSSRRNFLVIDLPSNTLIDFASPLNYRYSKGYGETYSVTLTGNL